MSLFAESDFLQHSKQKGSLFSVSVCPENSPARYRTGTTQCTDNDMEIECVHAENIGTVPGIGTIQPAINRDPVCIRKSILTGP